jgi:predicted lipoprotein with Yx(FWY)xxD motif
MKLHVGMFAGIAAAVVLAAGCGSSSGGGGSTAANAGNLNTTVQSEHSSALNSNILVNGQQMTLYTLSAEQKGKFICTKSSDIPGGNVSCVSVWIPLTVAKGTTPTGPVSLGTIVRPDDGATQVTYQGRPLYTFANDKAPGQASGNGFKDVGTWKAATIGSSSSSTQSTGGSGGYGY